MFLISRLLIIFSICNYTYAQNHIGFQDNFSGIQKVIFNPASILNTSYKYHFNVISSSFSLGNNNYEFDLGNFLQGNNIHRPIHNFISNSNSNDHTFAYNNIDVLGPSFLWIINNYNAIAITTRARSFNNIYNYNENPFFDLSNSIQKIDGHLHSNSWIELGFSFAGLFKNDSHKKIKFGASLKILQGHYASTFHVNDINTTTDYNEFIVNFKDVNIRTFIPTVNVNGSYVFETSEDDFNLGFGFDLGFEYEMKKNDFKKLAKDKYGNIYYKKSPYLFKVGVSLLDIGFINYNTNKKLSELNKSFSKDDYNYDIDEILDLIVETNTKHKRKFILPSTLSVNTDYNLDNKFYINANVVLSLVDNNKITHSKYVSNIVISPRYETLKFTSFLPISINAFGVYKAGIGIKTNYVFIGSSSIISNIISKSKAGDFYFGIHFPIFNKAVVKEYFNDY